MLQMLGHVKRRTEHLIGALDQAKRRTEHLIGALDQGRGQTDGAADVAALCLSWRRSVGARYGARLIYVGSVGYETVRIGTCRVRNGTNRVTAHGWQGSRADHPTAPPVALKIECICGRRPSAATGNMAHAYTVLGELRGI